MARMTSKLMVMGLAGLLAVPGAYAGGPAVNNPNPVGMSTPLTAVTNPFSAITGGLTGLTQMNGLTNISALTGQNFGQMLMNSVVTQLTSQLLGKIDPSGMLGQIAGPAIGQAVAGNFGGLNTGLTSNLLGGGIQNAANGGGMNFGGLGELAVNVIAKTVVDKVMGGIQSDDSSEDNGNSSGGTRIGGVVDENAPVPSFDTALVPEDKTSNNYVAGQYDATQGLQPDSRFQMSNGNYDTRYWCGYLKGQGSANVPAYCPV